MDVIHKQLSSDGFLFGAGRKLRNSTTFYGDAMWESEFGTQYIFYYPLLLNKCSINSNNGWFPLRESRQWVSCLIPKYSSSYTIYF